MEVALICAVGVPGVDEGADYCENVGGCGEEEGFDSAVVECFDDRGEEVGYGGGGDDAKDHDHLGLLARSICRSVYI